MSKSNAITEKQFNAVLRKLKSKSRSDVATDQGITLASVNNIRQAGNWEEFKRRKAMKVQRQSARRAGASKAKTVTPHHVKLHSSTATIGEAHNPKRVEVQTPEDKNQGITPFMLNEAYAEVGNRYREITKTVATHHDQIAENTVDITALTEAIESLALEMNEVQLDIRSIRKQINQGEVQSVISQRKRRWWRFGR